MGDRNIEVPLYNNIHIAGLIVTCCTTVPSAFMMYFFVLSGVLKLVMSVKVDDLMCGLVDSASEKVNIDQGA